ACTVINEWRGAHDLAPIEEPPMVSAARWHRFFLPLAERHLSPVQHQAVKLLGMFESYTSMAAPFEPTHQVLDPAEVLTRSIRYWARAKPRSVSRTPQPWMMVGA
ncbi:MAG TPA: hypothetical protein VFM54_00790, partial [Micromonosporaceae bacterium]|nr:hypothetical protein [Micromonosporaceae bacterium]